MAEIAVIKYGLAWQPSNNIGRIVLRLEGDDAPVELQVETASEFAALAAVLERNKVFYDKELGVVRSAE